jgi:hypothetical protein
MAERGTESALAGSMESLLKAGIVSDMRLTKSGGVELTIALSHDSVKSDAMRKTLAAISERLM